MTEVASLSRTIGDIAGKYGLRILSLDFTDVTLISRIGFSHEVFIQIYANIEKQKLNMALVISGERVYGIDMEGGFYHEHPFKNPSHHVEAEKAGIEDFVIKSLECLRKMSLI